MKIINYSISLLFFNGFLFAQLPLEIEQFDKRFSINVFDPTFSIHAPTGIIYEDIAGTSFTNLSDGLLRLADRPFGYQFQSNNLIYSELTKNAFSINHFTGSNGLLLIGPSQRAYWGPRSPGQLFPDFYDLKTVGNVYTVDLSNRRLSVLGNNAGTGALHLYRYSGGFAYVNTLTINAANSPVWFVVSDRKMKRDISDTAPVLSRLSKIRLKKYKYKGTEVVSTGFIAQEVQEAFPDLVEKMEDGNLAVNYMGFAPLAIQAINEQQEIIETLSQRIEQLEKLILEK